MSVRVTPDNFNRAESDMYFGAIVEDGGFGKFHHERDLTPIDAQRVIRSNRDTLYSAAVFDLDAGPVTITLPDAGNRFLSMQIIDEEQYADQVVYGAGTHTLSRRKIGTRYVVAVVRILVDAGDPQDFTRVHRLQDAIKVAQKGAGQFEVPNWDRASQRKVHDALLALGETFTDTHNMFGPRNRVDPVRHLIGTAVGWGGNPERDALYIHVTPEKNDGTTVYRLTVRQVPVDGFWSVSVYNAQGYFERNEHDLYTVNNTSAKRASDRSIVIQFGGSGGDTAVNWLPITPGWNYLVRLYRPRSELLDGTWTFPEAEVVG